uniref:Uncharacterized protein n=1 Tax=Oryza meridionalis TaxID=40149 RepID=A0A0E0F867_9ORYZ
MVNLLAAITMRSEFLRSLSVLITEPPPTDMSAGHSGGGFITLDTSDDAPLRPPPEKLQSLNLIVLGQLAVLRCLRLCQESYVEDEVTFNKDEFIQLRFLLLHVSNNTKKLDFKSGAAPKLEKIVWNLDSSTAAGIMVNNKNSGIEGDFPQGLLVSTGDTRRPDIESIGVRWYEDLRNTTSSKQKTKIILVQAP